MRVRGPRGVERIVPVDVVVFSGDFIPDNELARLAGLSMDQGSRGPLCGENGRTSAPGFFAAGNLVHPAETADVVAQRAGAVGAAAAAWLRTDGRPAAWGSGAEVRVRVADPLLWVAPNLVEPGCGVEQRVLIRTRAFLRRPRVAVRQGGRLLASHRPRRMIPNRSHVLPSDWLLHVRPGEDVHITVDDALPAGG